MLDQEVIKRKLEKITQDAWSVGRETTINHMLKWMLVSVFEEILIPHLNELEARVVITDDHDPAPDPLERRVAELEFFLNRLLKMETQAAQYGSPGKSGEYNASTDGSLPVPNGNAEATVKSPRGRAQTPRTSLS